MSLVPTDRRSILERLLGGPGGTILTPPINPAEPDPRQPTTAAGGSTPQRQPQQGQGGLSRSSLFRSLLGGALLGIAHGMAAEDRESSLLAGVQGVQAAQDRSLNRQLAVSADQRANRQVDLEQQRVALEERRTGQAERESQAQIQQVEASTQRINLESQRLGLEIKDFPDEVRRASYDKTRTTANAMISSGSYRAVSAQDAAKLQEQGERVILMDVSDDDENDIHLVPVSKDILGDIKLPSGRVIRAGTPIAQAQLQVEIEGILARRAQMQQELTKMTKDEKVSFATSQLLLAADNNPRVALEMLNGLVQASKRGATLTPVQSVLLQNLSDVHRELNTTVSGQFNISTLGGVPSKQSELLSAGLSDDDKKALEEAFVGKVVTFESTNADAIAAARAIPQAELRRIGFSFDAQGRLLLTTTVDSVEALLEIQSLGMRPANMPGQNAGVQAGGEEPGLMERVGGKVRRFFTQEPEVK